MSPLGGLLGAAAAVGVGLLAGWLRDRRRPALALRVGAYLRDLPGSAAPEIGWERTWSGIGDALRRAGVRAVERIGGGERSLPRRLQRAGLDLSVAGYRGQQLRWGALGFAGAFALSLPVIGRRPASAGVLLFACGCAGLLGVLARDYALTVRADRREQQIAAEFPAVLELLTLAVGAGEGPVAALERVTARASGAFAAELRQLLAEVRTGVGLEAAFDVLAARTSSAEVARFAAAVAVAAERGTPLAGVLRAQAADAREAGRRRLIETAARREVLMMVPVVFLILPTVVVFAFWPGLVGLRLVVR